MKRLLWVWPVMVLGFWGLDTPEFLAVTSGNLEVVESEVFWVTRNSKTGRMKSAGDRMLIAPSCKGNRFSIPDLRTECKNSPEPIRVDANQKLNVARCHRNYDSSEKVFDRRLF